MAIGVMGTLLAIVGAVFAHQGAWPVLPFAGLEALALAAGLYWVARRLARREVITVTGDQVIVEQGRLRPERRVRFPRAWVRVELEPAAHALHPRRLRLRCHGRAVEVGALLTERERGELAARLRAAVALPAGPHNDKTTTPEETEPHERPQDRDD